jgi:hypothetical protein
VSYGEGLVDKSAMYIRVTYTADILLDCDYFIWVYLALHFLNCTIFLLNCFVMCVRACVCMCVGFVMFLFVRVFW